MATALRYLGYYWLAISTLIIVLYNWLVLDRLPNGTETLEIVLFVPGLLLLAASFVISCRPGHFETDAGNPAIRSNAANDSFGHRHSGGGDQHPLKTGAALVHAGEVAEAQSHRDSVSAALRSPRQPSTGTLAIDQAKDLLVSKVVKNAGPLQKAILLLAEKDTIVADGLSRILQASDAIVELNANDRS